MHNPFNYLLCFKVHPPLSLPLPLSHEAYLCTFARGTAAVAPLHIITPIPRCQCLVLSLRASVPLLVFSLSLPLAYAAPPRTRSNLPSVPVFLADEGVGGLVIGDLQGVGIPLEGGAGEA